MVRLGAVTAAASAGLVVVAPAHAAAPGDFSLAAHRGYHASATENTAGALVAADDAGAPAMETDLRLTADGYMIVMHDATLDRTTNCQGSVDAWTLRRVRQDCRADDGQVIPTASSLLKAADGRAMNLLIEVKPDSQARWDTDQMERLSDVIDARGMRSRVMVSADNAARLRRVESVAQWLPTMWIRTTDTTVAEVDSSGADNMSANAANLSPELVAAMKAAGHLVWGRVSDSQADWEAYRADGVEGVVTNAVPEYLQWAGGVA